MPQRVPIVDLDCAEHIGSDIAYDLAGALCRDLIHPFGLEFEPADPVATAVRDDLRRAALGPILAVFQPRSEDLAGNP